MKTYAIVASLVVATASVAALAQTAPPQAKPATKQPPAAPAPAPFPEGAKVAFFDPQLVFQRSADGKAAVARVNALTQKKQNENTERQKKLQADQQKLQAGGSMLTPAARTQLEKDVEKEQIELQRFQQDAQAELAGLQKQLQDAFLKKLPPILGQVAKEKGLHILFSTADSTIAWAAAGLDLTQEVIKKLDAASKPAAPPNP